MPPSTTDSTGTPMSFRFLRLNHIVRSGLAMCDEDRSRTALVGAEDQLRVDCEAGIAQPAGHLVGLPAMDVNLHRMAAIARCLQPGPVADVEPEQQRPAGAQ